MKKGQMSFFFILGILLLFSILFVYFGANIKVWMSKIKGESATVESAPGFVAIQKMIETCIDQTAKLAVFYLGFIGGDVAPDPWIIQFMPAYFAYDNHYRIPYYVYEEKVLMLSDEHIKTDILAHYMDTKLQACTNGFKALPYFVVKEEKPTTTVILTDEEVVFSVIYQVSATKGDTTEKIGPYYTSHVRVRLKEILSIARTIVQSAHEDQRLIMWDYMTDITKRYYNITAYTEKDKTLVYRIIDLNNTIDNEPYKYQFGVKIA